MRHTGGYSLQDTLKKLLSYAGHLSPILQRVTVVGLYLSPTFVIAFRPQLPLTHYGFETKRHIENLKQITGSANDRPIFSRNLVGSLYSTSSDSIRKSPKLLKKWAG